jgi:signal transduction histidine kinase
VGLGLVLVLFVGGGFQVWHARSIASRVQALAGHMARLREGNFADAPPPDDHADELSDLRASVADTTEKLAAAYDSRDRLVADAAHELRTPLAAMRTTIDVTLRRPRSGEELSHTLDELRQEVIRLGELATKLLDLARLRASRVEQQPGDLRRVIDEAVERYQRVAEERTVTIAVEAPAEAPALVAVDALRQALENLLSNALRYAPEGSRVEVVLEPLTGAERGWRIVVRDQGLGIPPEQREVIFEPFHRLDHREPGAGLGLAIVRDIVRQHGGRVYVSPAPASGAELVVELPRADVG